eukprot:TRINITY_DN31160_c0_g1_i1.p1 TRINITY_DN31160_c0_g1~~TRINITY_DN31160_c0_g1_i1.p1  ORF type:complete len:107 (-),score=14.04 TRINITY_DN31160_c0_g1_i1:239-559(-)
MMARTEDAVLGIVEVFVGDNRATTREGQSGSPHYIGESAAASLRCGLINTQAETALVHSATPSLSACAFSAGSILTQTTAAFLIAQHDSSAPLRPTLHAACHKRWR